VVWPLVVLLRFLPAVVHASSGITKADLGMRADSRYRADRPSFFEAAKLGGMDTYKARGYLLFQAQLAGPVHFRLGVGGTGVFLDTKPGTLLNPQWVRNGAVSNLEAKQVPPTLVWG